MGRQSKLVLGLVLVIGGVALLATGGEFTTRRNVLELGDLKVSANEQRTVPIWAAGLVVVAGVVILTQAGGRKS